jgi:hypothetical protein
MSTVVSNPRVSSLISVFLIMFISRLMVPFMNIYLTIGVFIITNKHIVPALSYRFKTKVGKHKFILSTVLMMCFSF